MTDSDSDDSQIQVNIRTGTSTRRPQHHSNISDYSRDDILEMLDRYILEHVSTNTRTRQIFDDDIFQVLSIQLTSQQPDFYDMFDNIINNSLSDGLTRHNDRRLDIESRTCKHEEIDQECGICKDNFKRNDMVSKMRNCTHTFHSSCINEWGKYKTECPLCRAQIPVLNQ